VARALRPKDLERVAADTTVQEKAAAHPMPGSCIAPSRSSPSSLDARASNCAKAISGWPSAPPSWLAATPMPSVQARKAGAQILAHQAWPRHPRHKPQDRRQSGASRTLRLTAFSCCPGAPSRSAPARAESLFLARARLPRAFRAAFQCDPLRWHASIFCSWSRRSRRSLRSPP
jgi:hypothetical protein